MENLAAAYPDQPDSWHHLVARGVFEHLGRLLVELLITRAEIRRLSGRLRYEGLENLEAAIRNGKGYFLLSGHFGNWEWVAMMQGLLGSPLWIVTRPLDNPYLERWLAAVRSATGNRVIHKRNAIREVVKGIRERRGVAFVVDQHFSDRNAHVVPFFHRPAATTPALGTLAVRMGVPVVPVFSFPQPDGSYLVEYQEAIWPPQEMAPDEAAYAVTAEATRRIEGAIRRQPEAWFWVHRRWRTAHPDTVAGPLMQAGVAPTPRVRRTPTR